MPKVLLVQSRKDLWESAVRALEDNACDIHRVSDVYEGLETIESIEPEIVLIDITVPGLDGPEIVRHFKELAPDTKVIVAADPGDLPSAIQALEMGASDFVLQPVAEQAIRVALARAREKIRMRATLQKAVTEIRKRHEFERKLVITSMDGIIANDPDGNIIIFNEGASRIYGYKPEEAVGRIHVSELYPKGEARRVKKEIYGPDYGGPGHLINYHTLALTKDRQRRPIVLSATLIFEKGVEVATVGYFKDLTEIMRQLNHRCLPFVAIPSELRRELLMAVEKLETAGREIESDLAGETAIQAKAQCRKLQGLAKRLAALLEKAGALDLDQPDR